jgi:SIR2-like domain
MLLSQQGVEVMADDLSNMYELVAGRLLKGKVVPVLGAGANLGDRPPDVEYQRRGRYLPSDRELAKEIARFGHYPKADDLDLSRVSQYVTARLGESSLYDELHDVFDADYPPTRLHYFLARLARHIREAAMARDCMLLITTNYDDALEQAFQNEGEPYDLITYISSGTDRGLFRHIPFDGAPSVIRKPHQYTDLSLDRRTVIAKIQGTVDRLNGADSFVITEDDYIDYITRTDIAYLFPIMLAAKIKRSHFLFLGCSPRDWNVRVMLYRLLRETKRKSWAIEADPDPVDRATWDMRGVDILHVRVENFVAAFEQRLPALGGSR